MFIAQVETGTITLIIAVVGILISLGAVAAVWGSMRAKIAKLEEQAKEWETRFEKTRESFLTTQTTANTEFRDAVKAILLICTEIKVAMATSMGEMQTLGARLDALDKRMDAMNKRMDEINERKYDPPPPSRKERS